MNVKEEDYDMIFKVLIIGDSGVGKSNILLRFVKDEFVSDMRSTVGVEFGSRMMMIDGFKVKAQIWDTAGQERYKAITSAYYKGAKGVLIVYDITKKESYINLDRWLNDFKMKCDEDASIVLVGNKSDMETERLISKEEAELKAKMNSLALYETSAKTSVNIVEAFETLMKEIVRKFRNNMEDNLQKGDEKTKLKKKVIEEGNAIKLESQNEKDEKGKKWRWKKCCIK